CLLLVPPGRVPYATLFRSRGQSDDGVFYLRQRRSATRGIVEEQRQTSEHGSGTAAGAESVRAGLTVDRGTDPIEQQGAVRHRPRRRQPATARLPRRAGEALSIRPMVEAHFIRITAASMLERRLRGVDQGVAQIKRINSGINGRCRMRTVVAACTALAKAGMAEGTAT